MCSELLVKVKILTNHYQQTCSNEPHYNNEMSPEALAMLLESRKTRETIKSKSELFFLHFNEKNAFGIIVWHCFFFVLQLNAENKRELCVFETTLMVICFFASKRNLHQAFQYCNKKMYKKQLDFFSFISQAASCEHPRLSKHLVFVLVSGKFPRH